MKTMTLPKVIVLGGGNSPEREISLRSSQAVVRAASRAGYEVEIIDTKHGFEVLDSIDAQSVVLPMLHGIGGEDGEIQAELEKRRLLFLGTGSKASDLAFDKWRTKQLLNSHALTTPKGALVSRAEYAHHPLSREPHVLKANRNGSSIGIYIVYNSSKIDKHKVDKVFEYGEQALLEELIQGIEITVPILGNQTLPVIEIIPPKGEEFDYENKYNGETQELCPPRHVDTAVQKRAQEVAYLAHRTLGCLHLSRTDIMIDKDNQLFVLEVNTTPGMTDQSLYPKSAKVAGLDFATVVKKFVELAQTEKRYIGLPYFRADNRV